MHPSVRAVFKPLSATFEGIVECMYLDTHDPPLVTTGIGNLIEAIGSDRPYDPALRWHWIHRDTGAPATADEVIAEWRRIKTSGTERWKVARRAAFGRLILAPGEMQALFDWRLGEDERILRKRVLNWDTIPADWQLATLLLTWAMGPGMPYPKYLRAIDCGDAETALAESTCSSLNADRQAAIKALVAEGGRVLRERLDPTIVHWAGAHAG